MFEIKQATLEDIDEIYRIDSASFEESHYTHEILCNMLMFGQHYEKDNIIDYDFFVAFDNGKIVGSLITENKRNAFTSRKIRSYIYTISVDPKYQRNKIGTKLMEFFIESMKDYGKLTLHCRKSKPFLYDFYHKFGFDKSKEIITNYKNDTILKMIRINF